MSRAGGRGRGAAVAGVCRLLDAAQLRRGSASPSLCACREAAPVPAGHGGAAGDSEVPADDQPAHTQSALCAAGELRACGGRATQPCETAGL